MRLLRGIGAFLVATLVFLAIAELGLRAWLANHVIYDVEMSRYAQLVKLESPNPEIGHVHRPGAQAHLMGVDVTINSDGLRDVEHTRERRADGRKRIAVLGDSLTFGWGVEREDTFAALLGGLLGGDRAVEIVNFGTGNYDTTQEVALFREKGLAYRPDEVFLFYFINDAEPVPRKSPLAFLANFRVTTFYWSRLRELFSSRSGNEDFRTYYANLYRDGAPGWEATRKALRDLAALCRERGIALRVVLLPELHDLVDYPFQEAHEKVARVLRDENVPVLDLAPAFADQRDPHSLWVSLDDAHPNAKAHRLIAERSAAFLRGDGAAPSAANATPPKPSTTAGEATAGDAAAPREASAAPAPAPAPAR